MTRSTCPTTPIARKQAKLFAPTYTPTLSEYSAAYKRAVDSNKFLSVVHCHRGAFSAVQCNCECYREQVVHMVHGTRFRYFNFSSVFFDDRENFDEPHIQVWSPPPPPEAPAYSVATLLLLQDEPHYSFEKAHNPWWDLKHYSKT